jgi:hypothetical protein
MYIVSKFQTGTAVYWTWYFHGDTRVCLPHTQNHSYRIVNKVSTFVVISGQNTICKASLREPIKASSLTVHVDQSTQGIHLSPTSQVPFSFQVAVISGDSVLRRPLSHTMRATTAFPPWQFLAMRFSRGRLFSPANTDGQGAASKLFSRDSDLPYLPAGKGTFFMHKRALSSSYMQT